jgi:hypothetical protein
METVAAVLVVSVSCSPTLSHSPFTSGQLTLLSHAHRDSCWFDYNFLFFWDVGRRGCISSGYQDVMIPSNPVAWVWGADLLAVQQFIKLSKGMPSFKGK